MKKIVKFISCMLLVVILAACGCKKEKDEVVDVYMPDGAPALTMAKLMNDEWTDKGYKVKYHIVNPSMIASHITNGDADIAIVPTNAGANLYNKGNDIKVVAATTWGLLYMVGNENHTTAITDLNTLKGEVVGIIGQNQVPDLVFKYILEENGIEYVASDVAVDGKVALKYFADGPSMIPVLKNKTLNYGILGEPAATNSVSKANTAIVLDIQEEYKEVNGSTNSYPQSSLVVRSSFLKDNKEFVGNMIDQMIESSEWIENNIDSLGSILEEHGSTSATTFTLESLQRCNIKIEVGSVMKNAVSAFIADLYEVNAASVGNKLPEDEFYYTSF